jgi:ribosome recycling factor
MDPKNLEKELQKVIDRLQKDLKQLRAGRATPEFLDSVKVDAYGSESPVKNLANVSVTDAKTITIEPWDKNILEDILKGIESANLGVSVKEEGGVIYVKLPDLTEERRKEMVAQMKERAEEARVSIRNVRQEFMQQIEKNVEEGLSEDDGFRMKDQVEDMVKKFNAKIEEIRESKKKNIMEI